MTSPGPWWDYGVPLGALAFGVICYFWARYDAYKFDQKWGKDPGE